MTPVMSCVSIFSLMNSCTGEFRKCGILTPEFSWTWVDREMDTFATRAQDPYEMTDEQRAFVRKEIFPYWEHKSLEEAFLAQISEETKRVAVDTGFVDTDSKWRQAVGEITADYQDVLFKKGFGGIKKEAEAYLAELDATSLEGAEKMEFYRSIVLVCDGIIRLANRYGEKQEKWQRKKLTKPEKQTCFRLRKSVM